MCSDERIGPTDKQTNPNLSPRWVMRNRLVVLGSELYLFLSMKTSTPVKKERITSMFPT